jgi:hypothetical protein
MANKKSQLHDTELVDVDTLQPHPRNYREHPADQLQHIVESIREHGFYRNVVIAKDGTILAGHGVVKASKEIGLKRIPVIRLPIAPDDPRAIKVLVGDNEIEHLAEQDDRLLTELLKECNAHEIKDFDEAAHWVGMPEFGVEKALRVVVQCRTEEDRQAFLELLGKPTVRSMQNNVVSIWWPDREIEDRSSLKFESNNDA